MINIVRYFTRLFKHLRNSWYDFKRFRKYSAYNGVRSIDKLLPLLQWDAHILEKGLSLEHPRPFFGRAVFERLALHLSLYERLGGDKCSEQISSIICVVGEYLRYNSAFVTRNTESHYINLLQSAQNVIKRYGGVIKDHVGGTITFSRQNYIRLAHGNWAQLSQNRYSVRHFTGTKCPCDIIEQAVDLSRKSPSVCNRQCVRIAVVRDEEQIKNVLHIQGGAGGFSDKVGALLVVCGDLHAFSLVNERNQVYIDIGFFSMSLLYSFQYLGWGACPLHWFFGEKEDTMLRRIVSIPDNWTVGNLIVVGELPNEFRVPIGKRLSVCNIIKYA